MNGNTVLFQFEKHIYCIYRYRSGRSSTQNVTIWRHWWESTINYLTQWDSTIILAIPMSSLYRHFGSVASPICQCKQWHSINYLSLKYKREYFNPSVNHNICSRALGLENIAKQQLFSGLLSPGVRDKTTSFFSVFQNVFSWGESLSFKDGEKVCVCVEFVH